MLVGLTTAEDLLLNCLALSFILDIDEIIFSSFAPLQLQKTLDEINFDFYKQSPVPQLHELFLTFSPNLLQ